jgi:hypothetical protein
MQQILHGVYPLLAAGRPVTFVATKVTKKAFSREASLPHKAFALQSSQNHGLQKVALLRSLIPHASANICYALPNTQAIMFCLLHPKLIC